MTSFASTIGISCWANGSPEAAKFWQEVNEIALAFLAPELYNIVIIDRP
jgi:hypothetical protein